MDLLYVNEKYQSKEGCLKNSRIFYNHLDINKLVMVITKLQGCTETVIKGNQMNIQWVGMVIQLVKYHKLDSNQSNVMMRDLFYMGHSKHFNCFG